MEKNMTKHILKRHWKMSLFTVTRSSNQQQQKNIYLFEINSRFTFESHDAFFLRLPGLPCMNYEIVIDKAWGA